MSFKLILTLVACALAPFAHAQLFIDNAGPRDVLFAAGEGFLSGQHRVRARLDTDDKSLSATFFSGQKPRLGGLMLTGWTAKARALGDIEELFRGQSWPGLEAAMLVNWTSLPRPGATRFVNFRAALRHDKVRVVSTAGDVTEPDFTGGSATFASGFLTPSGIGFALSFGYERVSNYDQLEEVQVAEVVSLLAGGTRAIVNGGRTARLGALEGSDACPATVTITHELPWEPIDQIVKAMPKIDAPDGTYFGAVAALYAKTLMAADRKPAHALGLGLTLSRVDGYKPGERPSVGNVKGRKLSFPLSVFVEWRNLGSDEPNAVKAGVATVFTFP